MGHNIEGAIVRMLRLGMEINIGHEQLEKDHFGRQLRGAISIPMLIADLIDLGMPVKLTWNEELISVVYTIGGFYVPLVLTQKQDQPLVHGLVDFPESYGEVMRNSVCSHEEIAALAGTIFMKIHSDRGEVTDEGRYIVSMSPWMPYLVRYFPLVRPGRLEDEYIIG